MAERERILVVDDDERNRTLVGGYLGAHYDILEAESGARALDLVARESVDLVLLDVMMPGMSGYEVCIALKETSRGAFLPVILFTALDGQEYRNEGLAAGADDFLNKPVNRVELELRCRAFLAIRRQDLTIRRQVEDLRRLQALKDDLFALIVHDLRNPLTGLDGYVQLVHASLAGKVAPAVQEDLERALQASRRMREMLDGVLDVRLLEEGALTLRLEPVPAGALVADAIATVRGAGEALSVPIRSSADGAPVALADAKLARRALENLIVNALKHSPKETAVEIEVRCGADGMVEIDVADRGPGVPGELKGQLFTKFHSVEAARGTARRGYGLGLHLVKLVADAHGGAVVLLDREGGGSIFRLALPAVPGRGPGT